MHLIRRDTNDTSCPPSIPFCNPSVGPGPAIVRERNTNSFIRQPNDPEINTNAADGGASEAEINIIGVVVIVVMIIGLFCLWAGLAKWPRGKIRGWFTRLSTHKTEKARDKGVEANTKADKMLAEGMGSTPSAVDLTQADIEAAVSLINARVAQELRTVPPALERNISEASTVVEEERRLPLGKITEDTAEHAAAIPPPEEPPRAAARENSMPRLSLFLPGSTFGSMRFKK